MAEPTPGTAWKSKGRGKRSALAAKHLLALVILTLISFSPAGCGYIGYWMRAGGSDVSLTDAPDLEALRELAPENCHCLQGSFVSDRDLHEPLLVVAISRQSGDPEIATTRILRVPVSGYAILLPKGSYELVVFADLDGDGFFRSNEVVGRTAAGIAVVSPDRSPDGFLVEGPSVHLDLSRPATCDLSVDIRLTPEAGDESSNLSMTIFSALVTEPWGFTTRQNCWITLRVFSSGLKVTIRKKPLSYSCTAPPGPRETGRPLLRSLTVNASSHGSSTIHRACRSGNSAFCWPGPLGIWIGSRAGILEG